MLQRIKIGLLITVLPLLLAVYIVNYAADEDATHLGELKRLVAQEENKYKILRAEWATLNSPKRLEFLAAQYLQLEPVSGQQVVTLEDIMALSGGDEDGLDEAPQKVRFNE